MTSLRLRIPSSLGLALPRAPLLLIFVFFSLCFFVNIIEAGNGAPPAIYTDSSIAICNLLTYYRGTQYTINAGSTTKINISPGCKHIPNALIAIDGFIISTTNSDSYTLSLVDYNDTSLVYTDITNPSSPSCFQRKFIYRLITSSDNFFVLLKCTNFVFSCKLSFDVDWKCAQITDPTQANTQKSLVARITSTKQVPLIQLLPPLVIPSIKIYQNDNCAGTSTSIIATDGICQTAPYLGINRYIMIQCSRLASAADITIYSNSACNETYEVGDSNGDGTGQLCIIPKAFTLPNYNRVPIGVSTQINCFSASETGTTNAPGSGTTSATSTSKPTSSPSPTSSSSGPTSTTINTESGCRCSCCKGYCSTLPYIGTIASSTCSDNSCDQAACAQAFPNQCPAPHTSGTSLSSCYSSATSSTTDNNPNSSSSSSSLPLGIIIGAAVGGGVAILVIGFIIYYYHRRRNIKIAVEQQDGKQMQLTTYEKQQDRASVVLVSTQLDKVVP